MLYTKHLKAENEHKSMERARLNLDLLSIYLSAMDKLIYVSGHRVLIYYL